MSYHLTSNSYGVHLRTTVLCSTGSTTQCPILFVDYIFNSRIYQVYTDKMTRTECYISGFTFPCGCAPACVFSQSGTTPPETSVDQVWQCKPIDEATQATQDRVGIYSTLSVLSYPWAPERLDAQTFLQLSWDVLWEHSHAAIGESRVQCEYRPS